ncbi:retrovirus-related pol polyprotein from transposon TNT 1-94 [Tanacetum coccineum]
MSTSSNSTNSNQQTLAVLGANEIPPMLEKGNYIPWESRFRRPMVVDPIHPTVPMLEPLSKMTEGNKKQYIVDVRVMNYLLQAIPNDIYNSVDASKEGESLDSVHQRLTTLVNIMDCNNVRPIPVAINTKFLNCLQLEWRKYVTMVRHNQTGPKVSYDVLYDQLVQFKPHVLASRAKKAAKNHDPLALIAHSNASSSHSHANSSYSPQPYYDGRVDIQTKNAGYGGIVNKNAGRNRTQGFNTGNASDESNQIIQCVPRTKSTPGKANVQCYNCNEKGHYARESNDTTENVPCYDAKAVSQVHASSKVHEQVSHGKRQIIIQTTDDDQIDSNIIFDDPFVENNGDTSEHDSTSHDEYCEIQMLAYNVQRKDENQKRLNNELKKQKDLLQQELEMFKDWVKTFE